MSLFKRQLNDSQIYGSGLALILIFLLIYIFAENILLLYFAIAATVLLMIWPSPFRYFGLFWFALGELLGFVVSRVLLTVIYFLVVVPVSIFKRKTIRMRMKLDDSGKDSSSVFIIRNHQFSSTDLIKPF